MIVDLSADVTGGFEPHPFCPRVSTWSVQQLLKEVNKGIP
jgi:hypothetical protein